MYIGIRKVLQRNKVVSDGQIKHIAHIYDEICFLMTINEYAETKQDGSKIRPLWYPEKTFD